MYQHLQVLSERISPITSPASVAPSNNDEEFHILVTAFVISVIVVNPLSCFKWQKAKIFIEPKPNIGLACICSGTNLKRQLIKFLKRTLHNQTKWPRMLNRLLPEKHLILSFQKKHFYQGESINSGNR